MRSASEVAWSFSITCDAMHLDGLHAQGELGGDDLVALAADHPFHHVALARGEQAHARLDLLARRAAAAGHLVQGDRGADAVEQRLVAERLLDEVEGAGLHGPDRERDLGVAGDDQDRNLDPLRAVSSVCRSSPLMPGMRTSSTRQPGSASR